jgi:hypothetical protein
MFQLTRYPNLYAAQMGSDATSQYDTIRLEQLDQV